MAKPLNQELARSIGARVEAARVAAGFDVLRDFCRAIRTDERLYRRYADGASVPGVEALIRIAEACDVSIDWLVLGREEQSPGMLAWLETPLGTSAAQEHPKLVALMRTLPLRGFRPRPGFYDTLFVGLRAGLLEEVADEDELVAAARRSSS